MILYNAIRTPDGTLLVSYHRHDYVAHKDANGKYYAVDGGLEYLRRIGTIDYEELSLTDKDDFSKVREVVTWGTRGKDGKQPLEYKRLFSVLSSSSPSDRLQLAMSVKMTYTIDIKQGA